MKAQRETVTTTTITMNNDEAEWLRTVMQNPLNGDPNPANEDPRDAEMRRKFWEAVSS